MLPYDNDSSLLNILSVIKMCHLDELGNTDLEQNVVRRKTAPQLAAKSPTPISNFNDINTDLFSSIRF